MRTHPITQIIESEDTLTLDPRRIKTKKYDEILVFSVGGGSFLEYEGMMQLGKSMGKNILYGSTEIISPTNFLKQIERLGQTL